MSIFFGFSDECGLYKRRRSNGHLRVHPFYIRSTLLIEANEWKTLNTQFQDLKTLYNFPIEKEIKWAYLWRIRNYQKKGQPIPENEPFKFLEDLPYKDLIDFVEKTLKLLDSIEYKKIIITYSDNNSCPKYNEKNLLKMHLMNHMQRIEMQIQTRQEENLAVLFFDPINEETDKLLRDIYFDLFNSGDFIEDYKHIKDSLNIEQSHQSVGIQIADYISGSFSAVLKGLTKDGYERGKEMYFNSVHPNLRTYRNTIWGAGIIDIPTDQEQRKEIVKGYKSEYDKLK